MKEQTPSYSHSLGLVSLSVPFTVQRRQPSDCCFKLSIFQFPLPLKHHLQSQVDPCQSQLGPAHSQFVIWQFSTTTAVTLYEDWSADVSLTRCIAEVRKTRESIVDLFLKIVTLLMVAITQIHNNSVRYS